MTKMFFTNVRAVMHREWKRMVERPIYLFSSVFVMIFCYLFFLTFFSEGLPQAMPVGVVDHDNSYVSRTFIRNIEAVPQIGKVTRFTDYSEARDAMQRGNIYAFFMVDEDFEKKMMSAQQPEFAFYVNDAYLVPGSLIYKDLTYVGKLGSGFVQKTMLEMRGTTDESTLMAMLQPISMDAHLLANPYTNYGVYLINMLLPGIMQMLILLMTVFTIGYELKMRTTPQWLQTANGSFLAALTGKLLPYTLLFSLLGIIGNLILYRYMHFPMNGSLVHLSFATVLYVVAYQAIGVFCIGLLPVLREAISLVAVYAILGVSFTGFTFPVEAMPYGAQIFQHLFPVRFYFKIYVNEALNGAPLHYSAINFVAIAAFFLLPLLVYKRLKNAAIQLNYPSK